MKDIKFRAWGIKTFDNKHRMYEVLGMGIIDSTADPYGISYMEKDDEFNVYVASDNDEVDRLSDYILMQFTGLKDKNGKEIYEGDIIRRVEFPTKYYTAKFDMIFGLRFIDSGEYYVLPISPINRPQTSIEVIGNIYENQEQLKTV